jgi:dienelactone hydrolase
MKKIYISAFILTLLTVQSFAQCLGNRYRDSIFSGHTLTSNISYGTNVKYNNASQNLLLDVYEPTGDIALSRALVILVHGGSFIGGTKTGSDVVPMAKDLAKMGYVVASIEYRVGMKNFPSPGPDSSDATEAVMRAVHDGRAAVRYFRKDATVGSNTFKIDTNNIYMVGVSAGGFVALQSAYLDDITEFPDYIDTLSEPGLQGGVQGLSGNPGYSSDVNAIVNICGAMGDTTWMQAGDEPLLSFHGTQDQTVPYATDVITLLGFYPLLEVHGSYTISQRANEVGLTSCFETYEGQDHVPHINQPLYYDTTLTMTKDFLAHFICGTPINCVNNAVVGITEEAGGTGNLVVYPNPASDGFTVDLSSFEGAELNIELYDMTGRIIKTMFNHKADKAYFSRAELPSGLYFINVTSGNSRYSAKVLFE